MNRIKKRLHIPAALILLLCAALALPGCTQAETAQTNPEEASTVEFTTYDLQAQELIAALEADESLLAIERSMRRDEELPSIGKQAAVAHVEEKYGETFEYPFLENATTGIKFTSDRFPGYLSTVSYRYHLDEGRFVFSDDYAKLIIGQNVTEILAEELTDCYGDYRITAGVSASRIPQDMTWGATYRELAAQDERVTVGVSLYVEDIPGVDQEARALRFQQYLLDNQIAGNFYIHLVAPVYWAQIDSEEEPKYLRHNNWHASYCYGQVKRSSGKQTYYATEIDWRDNVNFKGARP